MSRFSKSMLIVLVVVGFLSFFSPPMSAQAVPPDHTPQPLSVTHTPLPVSVTNTSLPLSVTSSSTLPVSVTNTSLPATVTTTCTEPVREAISVRFQNAAGAVQMGAVVTLTGSAIIESVVMGCGDWVVVSTWSPTNATVVSWPGYPENIITTNSTHRYWVPSSVSPTAVLIPVPTNFDLIVLSYMPIYDCQVTLVVRYPQ